MSQIHFANKHLKHVTILEGDEITSELLKGEYGAYQIELHFQDGEVLVIEGCHDAGPDIRLD